MRQYIFILIALVCASLFAQDVGAKYLIITHDNYYDAILPLAQWKHKKGLRTRIAKLSQIGSTADDIRAYVLNAYNNWQTPPEYVLLVGAPNYLPFPLVNGTYTDNYYTDMDGDVYNEILSGRLTVHNTLEAQTVVTKMLAYDRSPEMGDSLWFKKACLIVREDNDGSGDDSIYWDDTEYAAGYLYANGYVRIDTLSRNQGDTYSSVCNLTNQGLGIVMYRGSGTNNWYEPFNGNWDVLNNGEKLPIVLSLTCNTLGTGPTATQAEKWFLTGTPATLRGAAGYFATTTHGLGMAYLRSAVAKGFFDGLFVNKDLTFGQACEDGRLRVYQTYGSVSEYNGFTTIGDPAMNIWTDKPRAITVTHDPAITAGVMDTINVSVQYQSNPVESAYVCIVFDTIIYQTGYTDSNGEMSFICSAPFAGSMDITVSGRNLKPYEGIIAVNNGEVFLVYHDRVIEDSLGDDDGVVDPGETIILLATIHNISTVNAVGVKAILRTDDSLIYFSDSVAYFGSIAAGALATGLNPFIFSVSSSSQAHIIGFDLLMQDADGDTWTGNFMVMTASAANNGGGSGPDAYGYYIYDDTDASSGNAPVYNWLEIAPPAGGPGSIIPEITDEDADTVTKPLPFTFKFYGINYNLIGISSNGVVELGIANYPYSNNDPIPQAGRARCFAAPFWDDLNPGFDDNGHGDIYQYYNATNHRWILEFYQVALGYGSHPWETFQIILRDPAYYPTPTGDGEFLILYKTVSDVISSTVGIEDETETRGLQYVYNYSYDINAAALQNGRALLVTTKPPVDGAHEPWLHLTGHMTGDSLGGDGDGVLEPGETVQVALTVANGGDTLAGSVAGTIRTASSSVVPVDSVAGFGDIAAGGAAGNMTDPFEITIAANPVDTVVGCVVHFVCNGGSYEADGYFTLFIHNESGVEELGIIGTGRTMLSAAPNPSFGRIVIKYVVSSKQQNSVGKTSKPEGLPYIKIFDAAGRLVKSFKLPATYSILPANVIWDGSDDMGRRVPAGVYFIQLDAAEEKCTEKTIFLR
ncbi:MAG TPA: C25 family cysteine peptidase [bacterium]